MRAIWNAGGNDRKGKRFAMTNHSTSPSGNGTSKTRVYRVRAGARFPDAGASPERLIRAVSKTAARSYAARNLFEVSIATQSDLEELLPKGVPVERVEPDPSD